RAALDARTARVLCVGFKGKTVDILEGPEEGMLTNFWSYWMGKDTKTIQRFVGFNILRFDLPFLVRRSWHLGIPVPADVYDGRFFHRNFIDLMSYWSFGHREEMISLDG